VVISATNRYVCLADGRKVPFDEYTRQSRELILDLTNKGLDKLLAIWIDKKSRQELREELRDHDIYTSAFRHYLDLPETDDVDILAKIGFQLPLVPTRRDRANRLWDQDQVWLLNHLGENGIPQEQRFKSRFWMTALDHYRLFGIDELEQARTYGAPQFVQQFGSFQTLAARYGSPTLLKNDLEVVKQHLYVPLRRIQERQLSFGHRAHTSQMVLLGAIGQSLGRLCSSEWIIMLSSETNGLRREIMGVGAAAIPRRCLRSPDIRTF
jgi:type I restriction enzyme, R subunit